jgi:hypothetical protein
VAPRGWKAAAGVFADRTARSVADSSDPESLRRVRAFKQESNRDKQGRPLA